MIAEPAVALPPPAPPKREPVIRFLFGLDRERRVSFVSPKLAEIVGASHGAIAGKLWQAVSDALGLDPDGSVRDGLAANRGWTAHVRWPVEGGETIAVDLSGFPVAGGDEVHGFGLCHPTDRQPDTRARRLSLSDIAESPAPARTVPPPTPVASEPPREAIAEPRAGGAAGATGRGAAAAA